MASELQDTLKSRRCAVERNAETWESAPTESSADASHFGGVQFGTAPSAAEWLRSKVSHTQEENIIIDALDRVLLSRGPRPDHAPDTNTSEHEERLSSLEVSLKEMHKRLQEDTHRMVASFQELSERESQVATMEQQLRLEKEQQKQREMELQNYPQPSWLEKCDGTFNVAVTGNSGVGKSLLINKLRRVSLQHHLLSAPVGVKETTLSPTMYIFPGRHDLRLWDLPGADTENFPRETYIRDMGLRYFDSVLIVTAGRFTTMESELRTELEKHRVPFYMVRTKVDIDVWNNDMDNKASPEMTLTSMRQDLKDNHGVPTAYLVSSRDPDKYDMPALLRHVIGLEHVLDANAPVFEPGEAGGWGDSWALPEHHSQLLSGIQGRWQDCADGCLYIVDGSEAHVTLLNHHCGVVNLAEDSRCVWWDNRWFVDLAAVARARETGELRWTPVDLKLKPLVWRWGG